VGLTSPVLPYLLAFLSVIMLVVILVAWPRLAHSGVRQIALRIVSVCALQALVLGLIFVIVNRSWVFYASWSDLFGSDKGAASVVAARHSVARTQQPLVITSKATVRVPGYRSAGGTLEAVTLRGQLSGLSAAGHVYLPAGYQPQSARRYPVLVVISNAASGSTSPYAADLLAQSAAVQIAGGLMTPMIMVMLPAALAPTDEACLDVPALVKGTKIVAAPIQGRTFFAEDVPNVLESAYRASSQPADWALLGDDSGGYCALQLALDNSYVFAVAVAPRGAYSVPPGAAAVPASPQFQQQDSLIWQLDHLPMQPVSVLFAGPGQASAPGAAQPFISLAQPPMRVSLTSLGTGRWPLANVLDWISSAVSSGTGQR
jgi:hypothetical protein